MKTVIYHKADYDGLFSAAVCLEFLSPGVDWIGWEGNDPATVPVKDQSHEQHHSTPSRESTYIYHVPGGYDLSCINVPKRKWLVKVTP